MFNTPRDKELVREYAISEITISALFDTKKQAFLFLVLDNIGDEKSLEAIQLYGERFSRTLADRIAHLLKIPYPNAHSFLFGGQLKIEPFLKAGYKDVTTTFNENKDFWKKCGISEIEYSAICILSI